ncbi:hypothetical protein F5Y06DRAFT_118269 [Hypoxylon sp. FL0890]|nr:hypothetical protein F5Y06DRAFT_118269 [Hypoxylon sp. FL0890]
MPPGGPVNGWQSDWICYCGQPAPYIYLAMLDRYTGEPIPNTGTRLAICQYSRCGFKANWEDREKADRGHHMRELPMVGLAQQGEFENVSTHGSGNHIGSTLIFNFNQSFSFRDLRQNSASIPIVQPGTLDFATIMENSAAVQVQRARESLLEQFRWYILNGLRPQ